MDQFSRRYFVTALFTAPCSIVLLGTSNLPIELALLLWSVVYIGAVVGGHSLGKREVN